MKLATFLILPLAISLSAYGEPPLAQLKAEQHKEGFVVFTLGNLTKQEVFVAPVYFMEEFHDKRYFPDQALGWISAFIRPVGDLRKVTAIEPGASIKFVHSHLHDKKWRVSCLVSEKTFDLDKLMAKPTLEKDITKVFSEPLPPNTPPIQ